MGSCHRTRTQRMHSLAQLSPFLSIYLSRQLQFYIVQIDLYIYNVYIIRICLYAIIYVYIYLKKEEEKKRI